MTSATTIRTTAMIMTTPAAGIVYLLGVVEDHVERAAVVGRRLDRLDDLLLRRQEQRHRVEVRRGGCGRVRDLARARHDAVGGPEHAVQQVDDDGEHDHEQHGVADPLEGHAGLPSAGADAAPAGSGRRSATTLALAAIPGNALRITSN